MRKAVEASEVRRILGAVRGAVPQAILEALYCSALRPQVLRDLRVADYDPAGGRLIIRESWRSGRLMRNERRLEVRLPPQLWAGRGNSAPLCAVGERVPQRRTMLRWLHAACARAGAGRLSLEDLRQARLEELSGQLNEQELFRFMGYATAGDLRRRLWNKTKGEVAR